LNLRFRDSDLYARNAFAATKAPEQRRIVEGTFSGPVNGLKKTSFLLSGTIDSEANQSIVYADTASGIFQRNVSTPFQRVLMAGTLNHLQGDRNTQSVRFSHLDEKNTNQGVGGTTLPEAGSNREDREDEATFSNQTVFSPGLLNAVKVLRAWNASRARASMARLALSSSTRSRAVARKTIRCARRHTSRWSKRSPGRRRGAP
jgi:hypothetical protein